MSVGTVRQRGPELAEFARHLVEGRLAAGRQDQVGPVGGQAPGRPGGPARAPRPTRCTPCPPAGRSPRPGPAHPLSSSWAQRRTDRPRRAAAIRAAVAPGLGRSEAALNKGEVMPICSHCGGEMTDGISCLTDPVIIGGKAYAPVRWGQELRPRHRYEPEECRDCGTPLGGVHHPGLLHRALPGLPWTGHFVRVLRRARLRVREPATRTLPLTRVAAGGLALTLTLTRLRSAVGQVSVLGCAVSPRAAPSPPRVTRADGARTPRRSTASRR